MWLDDRLAGHSSPSAAGAILCVGEECGHPLNIYLLLGRLPPGKIVWTYEL